MERSILFHRTRFVADAKWTSIKKKKLNNFHVTIRINSLFIKAIILVFRGEKKIYIVYDDSESTKREQRKREEIVLESGTNRSL